MREHTPTTLKEIEYQNMKLQFIGELRKRLVGIVDSLTEPLVDEDEPVGEGYLCLTEEENFDFQLFNFFIPFAESLDNCYSSGFMIGNFTAENFNEARRRFVGMAKFILQVFGPTVKIFEQKVIRQHDYTGVLDAFDEHIVKKFLH